MNIKNILFICGFACLLVLPSCKTTEANYRAAYEKAVAARDSSESIDDTVYGKFRRELGSQTVTTAQGDVEVKTQLVKVTKDGGGIPEMLRRYNVVVGQFKQKFNAVSMRDRLADNGYPGAFVIETAEPYYYIVTGSYTTLDEATTSLMDIKAAKPQGMREPCPFILDATARRAPAKAK